MNSRPREFASLLTQALLTIKAKTGTPLGVLQDELGWAISRDNGNSYLNYLRAGNVPKQEDAELLIVLTRELITRKGLDHEQARILLTYAGYPEMFQLLEKSALPIASFVASFDARKRLIGRERFVSSIRDTLIDDTMYFIVGIDGMGGIGKSAIAEQVAQDCKDADYFERVVEINFSDRSALFTSLGQTMSFDVVLNEIAKSLNQKDLILLRDQNEKIKAIKKLFQQASTLIVLDNLDSAGPDQTPIITGLSELCPPAKALLTSRHRFLGSTYRIPLEGFEEIEAKEFLLFMAQQTNIERIRMAKPHELTSIIAATGGSPLALKVVVGQLSRHPFETVLRHLKNVQPISTRNELDEYYNLYLYD